MGKILTFIRKDPVLSAAWILAVLSMLLIHPNMEYLDYIDFKSLGTLWSLMIVVAGLSNAGLFSNIGKLLIGKVRYVKQLVLLLVLMPFFFSMLITNDVSLLTFVPFAIYILKISKREDLLVPVVVMQTLAANLGSMFTPVGNPQNLYLYGISGLGILDFLKLMFPYTLFSMIMLLVCMMFLKGRNDTVTAEFEDENKAGSGGKMAVYGILFLFAIVSVAFSNVIRYWYVVIAVLIVCLIMERKILTSIDYSLLLTFVGFFIFTGNLRHIEVVRNFMTSMVKGHETIAGILFSQCISNVPAALLLSNFSESIPKLIVGVNLGGLGTLIASMASLISYKFLTRNYNELKGKYFAWFTVANVVFLILLMILDYII